jgi:hypothetical protein
MSCEPFGMSRESTPSSSVPQPIPVHENSTRIRDRFPETCQMSNPTRAPRWVDAIVTGQLGLQPAYGVGGQVFPPLMVWLTR